MSGEQIDNEIRTNGWTQYQKLVLAELQRHDEKQKDFQEQVMKVHLSIVELKLQTKDILEKTTNLIQEIKELDKAREIHHFSLSALKWQITTFAAGAAAVVTILVEVGIKYLFKG